jgi:VWFA-related protein
MFRPASALIVLGGLLWQAPQQPPFRTGVQVVEVDVRVFDRDGTFVTTLRAEDFEILEDGAPQQIVAMTLVGSPTTRAAAPTTPIAAPAAPMAPPTTVGRQTWIFFFDLNHLSAGGGFNRAREAVAEFVAKRFREGDLAGVIAGDRMVNNRLTSLRAELVQAVRSVKPSSEQRSLMVELTREWPRFRDHEEALQVARNVRDALATVVQRACADDPGSCQIATEAVRSKSQRMATLIQKSTFETFNAINGLASGLAKMPGPKTVVFLSDGFTAFGMEGSLRTIVGQTARAGARVYAIDVRGLNRGSQQDLLTQMTAGPPIGEGVPQFDGQADGVNSLAVDTGGVLIRNQNNIGQALDLIAADTGTYYVLGYQPANTNFDGKYRTIEIRVTRPGLKVRARQGYLALEPSKMLIPQPIKGPGGARP